MTPHSIIVASVVWAEYILAQATPSLIEPPAGAVGWWAMLGIGGVLAWGMFQVYRKDMQRNNDLWKGQSEMLMQVVKENTAAITSIQFHIQQSERAVNTKSRATD